jgi:hypothetical protein
MGHREEAVINAGRQVIGRWRTPRPVARLWLMAQCAGVPAMEAIALMCFNLRGSVPLAPGATAAAPYGVYHDLRFLLAYHFSWLAFAVEAAVMIVWRVALDTALVLLAWPAGRPRPAARAMARRTTLFTLAAAAVLLPSAASASAMDVMPVSDLLLGGMPVLVIFATLTPHGAVTSWWRRIPPWRAAAWSAATFGVITVGGAVAAAVPTWAAPLAVALTGLFNSLARVGIVRASVGASQRAHRKVPLVPLGIAAMAGAVIAVITLTMRLGGPADATGYQMVSQAEPGPPVLLVGGFNSSWNGDPTAAIGPGLPVERFSYRGLDAAGYPLSYQPQATQRPLDQTVRLLARQVGSLHARIGQPVSIVADSEGSLAVQAYLTVFPRAPVGKVVLLDPLIDPGRDFFPPSSAEGWGVATGAILRGLGAAVGATTPLHIYADGPFIRSVDDHGPDLQGLLACPHGHAKEMVLSSLADAVASPYSAKIAAPSGVVMRLHGYLLGDAATGRTITAFLDAGRYPRAGGRTAADRLISAAAAAWQAPPLAPALVPRWTGQPVSGCTAKRRALTAWLGG